MSQRENEAGVVLGRMLNVVLYVIKNLELEKAENNELFTAALYGFTSSHMHHFTVGLQTKPK